ncbi:conserved hypothetical protein [Cupriavidus taiwanensis]|nr:conserved hypothetical protein [Cupriavidus taiwanensis]
MPPRWRRLPTRPASMAPAWSGRARPSRCRPPMRRTRRRRSLPACSARRGTCTTASRSGARTASTFSTARWPRPDLSYRYFPVRHGGRFCLQESLS